MCEDHLQLPNIIWVGSGVHGEGSIRGRVGTWRKKLGVTRAAPPAGELGLQGERFPTQFSFRAAWLGLRGPPMGSGVGLASRTHRPEPGYIRGETAPLPHPRGLGTVWPCRSSGLSKRFSRCAFFFLTCPGDLPSSQSWLFPGPSGPGPHRMQREDLHLVQGWMHRDSHAGQGSALGCAGGRRPWVWPRPTLRARSFCGVQSRGTSGWTLPSGPTGIPHPWAALWGTMTSFPPGGPPGRRSSRWEETQTADWP